MLTLVAERSKRYFFAHRISSFPITVGRSPDNDVKICDDDVSRRHFCLDRSADKIVITDLSTNGTFLNGARVKSANLSRDDRISVGAWSFHIEDADGAPKDTVVHTPDVTNIERGISTGRKEFHMQFEVSSPGQPTIRKTVHGSDLTLGQSKGADVVVCDPFVSRLHCRFQISGDLLKLMDLSSSNGTYISGMKVACVSVADEGEISIGKSIIAYRIVGRTQDAQEAAASPMVGGSTATMGIRDAIKMAAASDAPVFISGESGTGKELCAQMIHDGGRRAKTPFVAVNCGAVPAEIIESQLFGHERGAFTGAFDRHTGLFEQASGGTLFLDEIGEMPLYLQARLLRAIECGSIRRVGGQGEIKIDVRVICATNKDIRKSVEDGLFRQDLFFRLFVIPISMPRLSDRPDDIEPIARHILNSSRPGGTNPVLTARALERLVAHAWPGNVRELKNTLIRSMAMTGHDVLDADDIRIMPALATHDDARLKDNEKSFIIFSLKECGGNITHAARRMGIARTTLQKKMQRLGIKV
jgi:transcriptional regulator with AAA-type ATPase domain